MYLPLHFFVLFRFCLCLGKSFSVVSSLKQQVPTISPEFGSYLICMRFNHANFEPNRATVSFSFAENVSELLSYAYNLAK